MHADFLQCAQQLLRTELRLAMNFSNGKMDNSKRMFCAELSRIPPSKISRTVDALVPPAISTRVPPQLWTFDSCSQPFVGGFRGNSFVQANGLSLFSNCRPWELNQLPQRKFRPVRECKEANKVGQWERTSLGAGPAGVAPSLTFTCCSYNVLCQSTLETTTFLYPECQPEHLTWEFRWPLLQETFDSLNADVFCLQEVEAQYVASCYTPYFKERGFEGVFKKRTGDKPDGCAIFWRSSKFKLHSSEFVEFFMPKTVMDRDNVGLVVTLKGVGDSSEVGSSSGGFLTIATTHLLYNLKRGEIKLAQMAMLLASVQKMARKVSREMPEPSFHPVIICGDFNATPFSPLHRFLSKGVLQYEGLRRTEISGQGAFGGPKIRFPLLPPAAMIIEELCDKIEGTSVQLAQSSFRKRFFPAVVGHRLDLLSVYDSGEKASDRLNRVSSVPGFQTVDYIFYSKAIAVGKSTHRFERPFLVCKERCPLPFADEVKAIAAPNSWMPSDHFPLLSKFEIYK